MTLVLTTVKAAHLVLNTRLGSRFLKRCLMLSSAIACHSPRTPSEHTQAWETLSEKTEGKNSSVSASSEEAALAAQSIQHRSTFSLLLYCRSTRSFLEQSLMSLVLSLSSRCALTFLTPSLTSLDNVSTFFLCSPSLLSLPPCCLCISAQSQVLFQTAGSVSCHVYSRSRTFHSCTWRMLSFKTWQPSTADSLFRTAFLCIATTSSLNKPKICYLEV